LPTGVTLYRPPKADFQRLFERRFFCESKVLHLSRSGGKKAVFAGIFINPLFLLATLISRQSSTKRWANMMEYAIETRNLTKRIGNRQIVKTLSLRIPKGSVYGLLGPNGAGKSTTLKLLTGLMRPSEGEVHVFGKPWSRDCLGRIGALIETPALYGNLTAFENLLVHSRLMGLPQEEIDRALVITGLETTGKKLVSHFSLGMKQRLGLAIALLGDPEILILDEPTNGLDPIGIEEFRELIRLLNSRGKTILLSSHILSEVAQLVDHIGIISGGELKLQAPIGEKDDLETLFLQTVRR
jgi:gallidermin-class lantibiotic protection ABC transporter ATP-binding subunit